MISIPIWLFALLIVASVPFAFFAIMLIGAAISLAIDLVGEIAGKGN